MKQEDLELIIEWFAHIEQIADDRKTLNGVVMEDWAALDEIKCKARNCQEYIKNHCIQPETQGLDKAADEYGEKEYSKAIHLWDEGMSKHKPEVVKEDFVESFKDGAKWDAEQGVTYEGQIKSTDDAGGYLYFLDGYPEFLEDFDANDKVIVQIRKK